MAEQRENVQKETQEYHNTKEKAATFCNMDLYKKELKSIYERVSV